MSLIRHCRHRPSRISGAGGPYESEPEQESISAAEDSTKKQAVALIGDSEGRSGSTDVTFKGLASVPWLAGQDSVNVVVKRIPEQASLTEPQEMLNRKMTITGGTITVPVAFQAPHDAFAIYLTPAR